jgi:hypothetical protein
MYCSGMSIIQSGRNQPFSTSSDSSVLTPGPAPRVHPYGKAYRDCVVADCRRHKTNSLIFTHNRLGISSDLLYPKSSYILSEIAPLTTLLISLASPPYLPTCQAIPPRPVVSGQRPAIPAYAVSAPETRLLAFRRSNSPVG